MHSVFLGCLNNAQLCSVMIIARFISFGNVSEMNHVPCNDCPDEDFNNVVRFHSEYQEWLQ